MVAVLAEIVIESADPTAAAAFWAATLGWSQRRHEPGGVPWVSASGDPAGDDLKLVFVAAGAGAPATRLYLSPAGASQEQELARLAALGATRADPTADRPWVRLVDPGGTSFSLLT